MDDSSAVAHGVETEISSTPFKTKSDAAFGAGNAGSNSDSEDVAKTRAESASAARWELFNLIMDDCA